MPLVVLVELMLALKLMVMEMVMVMVMVASHCLPSKGSLLALHQACHHVQGPRPH